MKLINTDGMAFIGPGSEWFWTAISGIVLAVTFLAIYRQLRLQRSAGAVAQNDALNREWDSERFLQYRLDVYVALRDAAHVPDGAAGAIGTYWEGVGALIRAGHLDRKLLWESFGGACELWWVLLTPYAHAVRARDRDPLIFEHFEWLAATMHELDSRAGVRGRFDGAAATAILAPRIARERELLRTEQSLRTVIIASPEAVPPAPLGPPAAVDA